LPPWSPDLHQVVEHGHALVAQAFKELIEEETLQLQQPRAKVTDNEEAAVESC
jgi:hypothetical protein